MNGVSTQLSSGRDYHVRIRLTEHLDLSPCPSIDEIPGPHARLTLLYTRTLLTIPLPQVPAYSPSIMLGHTSVIQDEHIAGIQTLRGDGHLPNDQLPAVRDDLQQPLPARYAIARLTGSDVMEARLGASLERAKLWKERDE